MAGPARSAAIVRVIYRLLSLIFLLAGILALGAYLPLHDGCAPWALLGDGQTLMVVLALLLLAVGFFGLAGLCHRKATRCRYR